MITGKLNKISALKKRVTILERQLKEIRYDLKCIHQEIKPDKEILEDIEPLEKLARIVCNYLKVDYFKLSWKTRKPKIVEARYIVAYFGFEILGYKYETLQKFLGYKYEGVLTHAKNKIETEMTLNPYYIDKIDEIRALIKSEL